MTEARQPVSTGFFSRNLRGSTHLNVEMPYFDIVTIIKILFHALKCKFHNFHRLLLGLHPSLGASHYVKRWDGESPVLPFLIPVVLDAQFHDNSYYTISRS
jgi:hypothetical protein